MSVSVLLLLGLGFKLFKISFVSAFRTTSAPFFSSCCLVVSVRVSVLISCRCDDLSSYSENLSFSLRFYLISQNSGSGLGFLVSSFFVEKSPFFSYY